MVHVIRSIQRLSAAVVGEIAKHSPTTFHEAQGRKAREREDKETRFMEAPRDGRIR